MIERHMQSLKSLSNAVELQQFSIKMFCSDTTSYMGEFNLFSIARSYRMPYVPLKRVFIGMNNAFHFYYG